MLSAFTAVSFFMPGTKESAKFILFGAVDESCHSTSMGHSIVNALFNGTTMAALGCRRLFLRLSVITLHSVERTKVILGGLHFLPVSFWSIIAELLVHENNKNLRSSLSLSCNYCRRILVATHTCPSRIAVTLSRIHAPLPPQSFGHTSL